MIKINGRESGECWVSVAVIGEAKIGVRGCPFRTKPLTIVIKLGVFHLPPAGCRPIDNALSPA
jgi:hypothetical protein